MRDEQRRTGWTRRDVMKAALAVPALAMAAEPHAARAATPARRARNCIFIVCTGAPPQHETWDPKPEAPSEIRGPFGAIPTSVPGLQISELLPRLASRAHRFSLIRSVHRPGSSLHEAGLHWIQTGGPSEGAAGEPNIGAVVSHLTNGSSALPASVLLPHPLGFTGALLPQGQGSGWLGAAHAPVSPRIQFGAQSGAEVYALSGLADLGAEPAKTGEQYGDSPFGKRCLQARRMIEAGARFVTVNQFDTVFNCASWDCHGYPDLPTRVADLKDEVAPTFDRAVSALIDDLTARGLYVDTVVCCVGEMGRAPRISSTGGRDHWTGCWSVMIGGGGVPGGQVIGASDAEGAFPHERPVHVGELVSTIYHLLGIDPAVSLVGTDGVTRSLPAAGYRPVHELV